MVALPFGRMLAILRERCSRVSQSAMGSYFAGRLSFSSGRRENEECFPKRSSAFLSLPNTFSSCIQMVNPSPFASEADK